MCSRATCPQCHRPTYVGCGNHVEQVLGDVPPSERCQCQAAPSAGRGWLSRRRGR